MIKIYLPPKLQKQRSCYGTAYLPLLPLHSFRITSKCFINLFESYMYKNHHHHVLPLAQISLTLSRHFSLLFITSGRSSGLHPVSHIAAVCMFKLVVLLLLSHMRGSIGVHHLWARPCFSNSVLHVWFV